MYLFYFYSSKIKPQCNLCLILAHWVTIARFLKNSYMRHGFWCAHFRMKAATLSCRAFSDGTCA